MISVAGWYRIDFGSPARRNNGCHEPDAAEQERDVGIDAEVGWRHLKQQRWPPTHSAAALVFISDELEKSVRCATNESSGPRESLSKSSCDSIRNTVDELAALWSITVDAVR
jgi:hypothetical protein